MSYIISAYDHLIKWTECDAFHSPNNDEVSSQASFMGSPSWRCWSPPWPRHKTSAACTSRTPLSQGRSWRHGPWRTIAALSGYDVPLMKSNGLKQYFPKGWNWNLNTVIWFHRRAIWRCQISFAGANTVWRSTAQPPEKCEECCVYWMHQPEMLRRFTGGETKLKAK